MNAIEKIQALDTIIRGLQNKSHNRSNKPMARLRAAMAGAELSSAITERKHWSKKLNGSVKRGLARGKIALAA